MIFLTVGTQGPFDRLVRAVDAWCSESGMPVFGQIGGLTADSYRPKNFEYTMFMEADAYQEKLLAAAVLVGHAGMGSIIAALSHAKPLVICPRRAALGEQRNDHQLATAEKFGRRAGIFLAWQDSEVAGLLDRLVARKDGVAKETISPEAGPELMGVVRNFVHGR